MFTQRFTVHGSLAPTANSQQSGTAGSLWNQCRFYQFLETTPCGPVRQNGSDAYCNKSFSLTGGLLDCSFVLVNEPLPRPRPPVPLGASQMSLLWSPGAIAQDDITCSRGHGGCIRVCPTPSVSWLDGDVTRLESTTVFTEQLAGNQVALKPPIGSMGLHAVGDQPLGDIIHVP